MSKPLVLIALSAAFAVSAEAAAPSPLPALAESVIPPIIAAFGSVNVGMDLYRYHNYRMTLYRGIQSSTTFDTQAVGMTALSSGTLTYRKISRKSGPGLENPVNTTDTSPFTISIGGSDGDVPFELRRHFCSMPTTTINGSPDVFVTSTESEAVFRIIHRYTTNPLVMSTTTSASINCINWQKERSGCDPMKGPMSYSFDVTLVNNGITYQGIPGPNKVNMRHATGSGIGITW